LPGSTPLELQEVYDNEDPELFVPADAHHGSHFGPEQVAEWRRHENEQWAQENLAGYESHSHDPGQHIDPRRPDAFNPEHDSHNQTFMDNNHFDQRTPLFGTTAQHHTSHRTSSIIGANLPPSSSGTFTNGDLR
jgi:hypothetical protein